MTEDDYWLSSDTKAFNFEEDELIKNQNVIKPKQLEIENTFNKCFQRSFLPITSVVTQQCLNKLLNPFEPRHRTKTASIEQTIKQILLNHSYTLECYRSVDKKTELLDAAIRTGDGNAVLMVVLFLTRTLKKQLVYKILSTRPIAVQHYIAYLTVRLNLNELSDILTLTGYTTNVGFNFCQNSYRQPNKKSQRTVMRIQKESTVIYLFRLIVKNTSAASQDVLLKKLQSLYANYYRNDTSAGKNAQILKNYIDLIDWQLSVKNLENMSPVVGVSVNKSLAICCQYYWHKSEEHLCSPQQLIKTQNMNEYQLHWIYLVVKAKEKAWDDIVKMFIKNIGYEYVNNWIRNKKTINSSLNLESIINHLGEQNAPNDFLLTFLSLMTDGDKSVTIAMKFKCHRYVINYYVTQKDRNSLVNYKSKIPTHAEDYFLLENVLSSTTIKWKM